MDDENYLLEKVKLAIECNNRIHPPRPRSNALINRSSSLLSSSTSNPNLRNRTSASTALSPIRLKPTVRNNLKSQHITNLPTLNGEIAGSCEKGELQIHLVAGRVDRGVGYALISQNASSFMSECKSGKVSEFQTLVLQETDLNWEDVQPACCNCVVSGNMMFLLGGYIRELQGCHYSGPIGCKDVYMIDIEAAATSRRWTRAPFMSGEHVFHAAVCVDESLRISCTHFS